MATIAAPGKASAPAVSAALFQQDHFRARLARFSMAPKLYFYDRDGKTLAFVRNLSFHWNKGLRLFTDPTLSFELLTITPGPTVRGEKNFSVFDPVNQELAGSIRVPECAGLQRQEWSLFNRAEIQVGHFEENSAMMAAMRRYLTDALPQTYTFYAENCAVGSSFVNGIFSPEMEINLSSEIKETLDRRLVVAVLVLVLAGQKQPD